MSKFTVEFSMDNAAFEDATDETAAVLRRVIAAINQQPAWSPGRNKLRDSNGNTVGFWEYTP